MRLQASRVLVTGATGFLGRRLVPLIRAAYSTVFTCGPRSVYYDLRDQGLTQTLLNDCEPDIVIHLAAKVGGIGFNRERPAECIYDNLMMNMNVLHASLRAGVKKFVGIGSVCSYPKYAPQPMRESHLWTGYPEQTNAPYGVSKLALLEASKAYRAQYDFNAIHLIPTNLYGPGDNFSDDSSHVIPALIKRFCTAVDEGSPQVVIWGTGNASRAFLHVGDAAEGILAAAERYDSGEPLNLGTTEEWPIYALANKIAELVGYHGAIVYDHGKPDGQPRRSVNSARAKELLGWGPKIRLDDGLRETVEWWRRQCAKEAAGAA